MPHPSHDLCHRVALFLSRCPQVTVGQQAATLGIHVKTYERVRKHILAMATEIATNQAITPDADQRTVLLAAAYLCRNHASSFTMFGAAACTAAAEVFEAAARR